MITIDLHKLTIVFPYLYIYNLKIVIPDYKDITTNTHKYLLQSMTLHNTIFEDNLQQRAKNSL